MVTYENGIAMMKTQIKEGDVIILENGNWKVITMILKDGKYKATIIDPDEMRYYIGEGDFNNRVQNEFMGQLMEEG